MAKFIIGDIVRLKSGGPKMTVLSIYGTDMSSIDCDWFDDGELYSAHFPSDALLLAFEVDAGFYDDGEELSDEEMDELLKQSEYYDEPGDKGSEEEWNEALEQNRYNDDGGRGKG